MVQTPEAQTPEAQTPEARTPEARVPGWLTQFVARVVADINAHAHRAGAGKRGFTIEKINIVDSGRQVSVRLRDTEAGTVADYPLVASFETGVICLTNGHNRIGYTYPIRFGEATGPFAD